MCGAAAHGEKFPPCQPAGPAPQRVEHEQRQQRDEPCFLEKTVQKTYEKRIEQQNEGGRRGGSGGRQRGRMTGNVTQGKKIAGQQRHRIQAAEPANIEPRMVEYRVCELGDFGEQNRGGDR